jgi:hypothetical protein
VWQQHWHPRLPSGTGVAHLQCSCVDAVVVLLIFFESPQLYADAISMQQQQHACLLFTGCVRVLQLLLQLMRTQDIAKVMLSAHHNP